MAAKLLRIPFSPFLTCAETLFVVCDCFILFLFPIIIVLVLHGFDGTVFLVLFVLIGAWNLSMHIGKYFYKLPKKVQI